MKFKLLFLLLPVLWVGCDEAEEAIEEELCVTESQALTAASEALDGTTEAFENMCTAYGDAITCLSNAGEDVSELQEGYDELCGEQVPLLTLSNLCITNKPRHVAGFFGYRHLGQVECNIGF